MEEVSARGVGVVDDQGERFGALGAPVQRSGTIAFAPSQVKRAGILAPALKAELVSVNVDDAADTEAAATPTRASTTAIETAAAWR